MEASGLRGRGGAGFLDRTQVALRARRRGRQKYVICNADEGDPGAFMDRSIVEGDPHSVLEGMAIAAYAIGASEGYVYVRAEYPLAVKRLRNAIDEARERGFLGKDILGSGFSFDVRVKEGAGAFVCGEETALMASIEGQPRHAARPPAVPRGLGAVGKADLHQQRRDAAPTSRGSPPTAPRPTRASAPVRARAPRSSRSPARCTAAASSRCRWA